MFVDIVDSDGRPARSVTARMAARRPGAGGPTGSTAASTSAGARRLLDAAERVDGGRPRARIVRRAGTTARPIMRLDGCDDRDAAEALRGAELMVAAADAPALERGRVVGRGPRGLRRARRRARGRRRRALFALPSCEVLEVDARRRRPRLLVPLVADAVRDVDIERRRDRRRPAVPRRGVSVEIDVFTLFPEAFDWFRAPAPRHQRDRARAPAATSSTTATTRR